MGAQPNNLSNNTSASRSRKYDTYSPRSGSVRGRVQPALQSRPSSSVAPSNNSKIPSNAPVAVTSTALKSSQTIKQTVDVKPKAFKRPPVSTAQNKKIVRPSQYRQSSGLALSAVEQSVLSESDNNYPNTVYGSAKRKLGLLQKAMYALAVTVVVFSGFVSVQSFITNNQAQEQIATLGDSVSRDEQGVSEGTGNDPSEEPIDEAVVRNFIPANPEDPRFLRIPELGVFSRIKNLGVTPEGAVDAPRNIFDTGWYNGSARPGSKAGSSLILGHVSGWTGPGVFKKINELPVGGEFEIEKGTGEIIKYSVVRSEQLPVDQINMSRVLSTEVAGEHDLKLMTCSGKYNSSTETFEDRFIVYAKRI